MRQQRFGLRESDVREGSHQEIDDKNKDLRDYLATYRDKRLEFLDRYEMSWIYHDSALEGVVYSSRELNAALHGGATKLTEAFPHPARSDDGIGGNRRSCLNGLRRTGFW